MNEQRVTTKHVAVGDTMVFPTHFDFSDGTGVGRRVERSVAKVVEIRNDSQAKTIIRRQRRRVVRRRGVEGHEGCRAV